MDIVIATLVYYGTLSWCYGTVTYRQSDRLKCPRSITTLTLSEYSDPQTYINATMYVKAPFLDYTLHFWQTNGTIKRYKRRVYYGITSVLSYTTVTIITY